MPTALVKPVGDRCNLSCRYCFYRPGSGGAEGGMSEEVLSAMTGAFLSESESPVVFAWQGGEPTLAGLDFYRRALELQARAAAAGQRVVNTFQTNGSLIDGEWADFLVRNDFLVGLSIDGPEECHDAMRRSRADEGSHRPAVGAWRLLRERGGRVNVLSVVQPANWERAEEVYRYLTRELGATHLQFIPMLSPAPGAEAGLALEEGQYGRFLGRLFELWAGERERAVSVKLFDDMVLRLAGKPMRDCAHSPTCDSHLVVERDGSVYPCDFFVSPEHRLGNVREQSVAQLLDEEVARRFRAQKQEAPPGECSRCPDADICSGGCCAFWRRGGNGEVSQRLCPDLRAFFRGYRPHLESMARAVRGRWREWGVPSGS